jgi:diguanylate cyclase (GGDEF)-like protein
VQQFCEALTRASPHLRLCWVWFGDASTPVIEPAIVSGPASAFAHELRIPRTVLTERGPAFRALAGRCAEPFNVSAWSLYGPWREAAQRHDVRAVIALPLVPPLDQRRGLFVLYADVPDYFDLVGVALFEALAELVSSVLSHSARHQQLEHAAHTDMLTGLPNRAHAQALVEALLAEASQRPMSVLLLDLDHFKHVNDRHGHAMGDAVLHGCADALRQALRRHDGVARWGGEEFMVWLPQTDLPGALAVADKLRLALAGQRHQPPRPAAAFGVTGSIGVAEVRRGELLLDALARADRAMYQAKQGGRDRVAAA